MGFKNWQRLGTPGTPRVWGNLSRAAGFVEWERSQEPGARINRQNLDLRLECAHCLKTSRHYTHALDHWKPFLSSLLLSLFSNSLLSSLPSALYGEDSSCPAGTASVCLSYLECQHGPGDHRKLEVKKGFGQTEWLIIALWFVVLYSAAGTRGLGTGEKREEEYTFGLCLCMCVCEWLVKDVGGGGGGGGGGGADRGNESWIWRGRLHFKLGKKQRSRCMQQQQQ